MMAEFHTPPVGQQFGALSVNTNTRGSQTARKHTPYTKTPRTRRIVGQERRTQQEEVCLGEIAAKTWRAYKVTPLYQFSHTPQDLRLYSKLLGAYLESETTKGIGFETENADKAVFSLLPGLANEDDKEAVKIVIKSKPHPTTGERKDAVVAILCSVDMDTTRLGRMTDSFTCLPVLLTRGLAGLVSLLIAWIKSQFDCHISHMSFSAFDLAWMVALWAGSGNVYVVCCAWLLTQDGLDRKGAKPTELVYSVPKECEGLNRITLTIEPQDCQKLWTNIHTGEQDELPDDEVFMFIKSLESHFYHNFRVKLAAMHLANIGTSIVYVGSEGRIKIFSSNHIHQILQHITQLALEGVLPSG